MTSPGTADGAYHAAAAGAAGTLGLQPVADNGCRNRPYSTVMVMASE
jgi:hypothetical protein